MPELIDKQAVRLLESDADAYTENWNDDYEKGFCDAINKALELPTIEPEVRHGRWIVHTTWNGMFGIIHSECSECKFDRNGDLSTWKFCPNCGRDMRATDTNDGSKGGNC